MSRFEGFGLDAEKTVRTTICGRSAGLAVRRCHQQLLAPGGTALTAGEELAEVLEEDDPVAEQAPALLRVGRDDMSCVAIGGLN